MFLASLLFQLLSFRMRPATGRLLAAMLAPILAINMAAPAALAQAKAPASHCLAMAEAIRIVPAAQFHGDIGGRTERKLAALAADEVKITYVGHSTFRIESADGIVAATDYAGNAGGPAPDVVTMNRAHSSHYTLSPDAAIKHVLKGWNDDGSAARHDLVVGDMRIRNITTDIRGGMAGAMPDGNSVFIFEAGGLCIGHLGHLHHELTAAHLGWIGKLDVVMVPVDGRMTMPHANMMEVLKKIRANVIIPMHIFGQTSLDAFLGEARRSFAVESMDKAELVLSQRNLPHKPTVMVMPWW